MMQRMTALLRLRAAAFAATACAVVAVAHISADYVLLPVALAGLAIGNIYIRRVGFAPSRTRTAVLLGVLVVLLVSLGNTMLLEWTSDPVLLARYLVFGLIVNSFDLRAPRHILGSVVVAGLIFVLLSHMAFGPWFPVLGMLYLLLALTAFALAHGEEHRGKVPESLGRGPLSTVQPAFLAMTLLVVLTATVLLLLLMPRTGSGRAGTMAWLPSRLDLTLAGQGMLPNIPSFAPAPGILAPTGGDPSAGGRYVSLGYVGTAADQAVMHVRSQVPSYWRGRALDTYDGQGWVASDPRVTLLHAGGLSFQFPDWRQQQARQGWYGQTFYIASDQANVLFAGYYPAQVYLAEAEPPQFLARGTVYRVVSGLASLAPGALRADRADPEDPRYLAIPPLTPRLAALAETVVADAQTDFDKAALLEQYLLNNYSYDLKMEPVPEGGEAADFFLFDLGRGYCAQFATAMAVMARHVGLPARVVVGYAPGVFDQMSGAFTVRTGDAHAWVEIRFRNHGWVAFDPTPRADIAAMVAGGTRGLSIPLLQMGPVQALGGVAAYTWGRLWNMGWPSGVLLALGTIGGALSLSLAAFLALRKRLAMRIRRGGRAPKGLEPARAEMLAAFHRMETVLTRRGLPPRSPSETPWEYGRERSRALSQGMELVQWLADGAALAAYGPKGIELSMVAEARAKAQQLEQAVMVKRLEGALRGWGPGKHPLKGLKGR
ncbi:MAG: hypothetical protein HY532_00630 [Chloroflexi bacterium]|nr:hypothetical protein [Chloroflexota bacterium]